MKRDERERERKRESRRMLHGSAGLYIKTHQGLCIISSKSQGFPRDAPLASTSDCLTNCAPPPSLLHSSGNTVCVWLLPHCICCCAMLLHNNHIIYISRNKRKFDFSPEASGCGWVCEDRQTKTECSSSCVYTQHRIWTFYCRETSQPNKTKGPATSIYIWRQHAATCITVASYKTLPIWNLVSFQILYERKSRAQLYMCSTQSSIDIQHWKVFRRHAGEISCFKF
jgi:hypothetical protein